MKRFKDVSFIWLFIFLLIVLGILDICNIDEWFFASVFNKYDFDIDFFKVLEIMFIPVLLVELGQKLSSKYLRFGTYDKYELEALTKAWVLLKSGHEKLSIILSPLQEGVPTDKDERYKYFFKKSTNFVEEFNKISQGTYLFELYIEDQAIITSLKKYFDEMKNSYYFWLDLYIHKQSKSSEAVQNHVSSKKIANESFVIIETYIKKKIRKYRK